MTRKEQMINGITANRAVFSEDKHKSPFFLKGKLGADLILQVDKRSGAVIKEFYKFSECEAATGLPQQNILKCIRGEVKSVGDFIFLRYPRKLYLDPRDRKIAQTRIKLYFKIKKADLGNVGVEKLKLVNHVLYNS